MDDSVERGSESESGLAEVLIDDWDGTVARLAKLSPVRLAELSEKWCGRRVGERGSAPTSTSTSTRVYLEAIRERFPQGITHSQLAQLDDQIFLDHSQSRDWKILKLEVTGEIVKERLSLSASGWAADFQRQFSDFFKCYTTASSANSGATQPLYHMVRCVVFDRPLIPSTALPPPQSVFYLVHFVGTVFLLGHNVREELRDYVNQSIIDMPAMKRAGVKSVGPVEGDGKDIPSLAMRLGVMAQGNERPILKTATYNVTMPPLQSGAQAEPIQAQIRLAGDSCLEGLERMRQESEAQGDGTGPRSWFDKAGRTTEANVDVDLTIP